MICFWDTHHIDGDGRRSEGVQGAPRAVSCLARFDHLRWVRSSAPAVVRHKSGTTSRQVNHAHHPVDFTTTMASDVAEELVPIFVLREPEFNDFDYDAYVKMQMVSDLTIVSVDKGG